MIGRDDHKEFLAGIAQDKVNIVYNNKSILNNIESLPIPTIYKKLGSIFNKVWGVHANKIIFASTALLLLTPIRMMAIIFVIYYGVQAILFKLLNSSIKSKITKDEEFYKQAIDQNLVMIEIVSV